MSTRRDRAARAVALGIWPHVSLNKDDVEEAYRIGDLVLAEVDRVPDASEFAQPWWSWWASETDGGMVSTPQDPPAILPSPLADDGAATPPASPDTATSAPTDGSGTGARTPEAAESATAARTAVAAPPSVLPRTFLLYRKRDITGLSGTGVVAWGCLWPDGTVALRWATEHRSTVHWDGLSPLLAVHGHQGATVLQWIDELPLGGA